jgi:multicomponent Na+:H+ antiporter subunit E
LVIGWWLEKFDMSSRGSAVKPLSLRVIRLFTALTLIWWIITDNRGWSFGIIAIAAATLMALIFPQSRQNRWSLWGLAVFFLYFLKSSFLAGIAVARLSFNPYMDLKPIWTIHTSSLPPGLPRLWFIIATNLIPGTLSAELDGNKVTVHVLHTGLDADLVLLEQRIASIFLLKI